MSMLSPSIQIPSIRPRMPGARGARFDGDDGRIAASVLVVSDNPELLDVLKLILEDEGMRVATSLQHPAASQLQDGNPSAMVLDLLSELDEQGWEFLTTVRLDPVLRKIPIVVCTAASRPLAGLQEKLAAQGVRVVYKPFEIDDLLSQLEAALRNEPLLVPESD